MADEFDLEALVHLEQTFYDAGYTDGFAHGRIHGLIEGRALGREKGFETWEEIGFYEGFATTWQAIYAKHGHNDQRAVHHIKHLLDLISQFPQVNPSSAAIALIFRKLQRQIRSRYKALCASLGVKPTLRAVDVESTEDGGVQSADQQKQVWKLEEDAKRPTMQGLSF
ncbi:hypothetical protein DFJ58DRAFT_906776 [Suillus subalutaceus]|uniref:uncharacterized protein n=1 Tax=Suillus subalutaceus TaxID=48586 RepID=UPI001B879E3F|nr:uncharacterized protein DFJ58DRAFT_906776 [Suillus subalutaceus]KAG1848526.1 hypothetical protein DFJ58DRAFT_906776 [Suillus subalutaceus]